MVGFIKRKDGGRAALLMGTALVTSILMAGAVQAQTAPQTDDRASQVDDIVVTAQKREERLQDVPIAVTAVTTETLQTNRIVNVNDLSGIAPNVVVRPAAGGASLPAFSVRGVVSYGVVPGSDKEVSTYLDGVYLANTKGSIFELPDIARIEVLRGPQGTLFGRNATAGAISIITSNPSGEFGVRQEFTVGNYDQLRSRTTVNTPSWGPLSGLFSYVHSERRGDTRNSGAGTLWDRTGPNTNIGVERSPDTLGDKDLNSYFAAIRFEPNDRFSTTYKFDRAVDHFTPNANALLGINPSSPLIGGLLVALFNSQPTPVVFNPADSRPEVVNNSFTTPGYQTSTGHNLTSEFQLNDSISFKNIAHYRTSYLNETSDLSGAGGLIFTPQTVVPYATLAAFQSVPGLATASPAVQGATIGAFAAGLAPLVGSRFVIAGTTVQDDAKQWGDELQMNVDREQFSLTAGLVYFGQESNSGSPRETAGTVGFVTFPQSGRIPLGNQSVSYLKATSTAAYVQGNYHVTPQLDIVAGYRITHDEKSGSFQSKGTYVFATPGNYTTGTVTGIAVAPFTYSDDQPAYTAGLNYKPNADILLYGKYSRSFVAGGSVGGVDFIPEIARSWEAGVKADLFDRALRTNLSVFYVNYDDLQTSQSGIAVGRPDLSTVIITQGDATAKGAELEVTYVPTNGLTLAGTLGYTDVQFDSVAPVLQAGVGTGSPNDQFLPTLIPDFTYTLSAQYETQPIWGDAYVFARVDAIGRTKQRLYSNPVLPQTVAAFAPLEYGDAQVIVNARIALKNIPIGATTAELAIWGRNLTDDQSITFPVPFSTFGSGASYQAARTFGIDLNFDF